MRGKRELYPSVPSNATIQKVRFWTEHFSLYPGFQVIAIDYLISLTKVLSNPQSVVQYLISIGLMQSGEGFSLELRNFIYI